MGLAFVDPVTDTIENVYEENEVVPEISVVCPQYLRDLAYLG